MTPKGVKVDKLGCPIDSDNDGVPDYLDECNDTPVAAFGWTNEKGCIADTDTDGDGVIDYLDECPNTPQEARGYVDKKGCLLDTDGDGVPDYLDECNDTKPGMAVNEYGCNIDNDGDGVPNEIDECPELPGTAENNGCPDVSKEILSLLKMATDTIQFQAGKAELQEEYETILNTIALAWMENPACYVRIKGYTDNTGSPEVNRELSDKRAKSVREYLVLHGIQPDHITAIGYGDADPVADNDTKEGRTLNNRIEFEFSYRK